MELKLITVNNFIKGAWHNRLAHLSCSGGIADGKREQSGFFWVTLELDLCEGSCVSLDGLADFALNGVELHVSLDSVSLSRYSD